MTNAIDLAEAVISRLEVSRTQSQGEALYPWIAVGHEIITPWQLVTLSDADLRRPEWDTADNGWITGLLWSMRGYAQLDYARAYPTFLTGCFTPEKVNPGIILFWPPRKAGKPIEIIQWLGTDERVLDVLEWLCEVSQVLEPYDGARRMLYTWNSWHGSDAESTPVESIPAWEG